MYYVIVFMIFTPKIILKLRFYTNYTLRLILMLSMPKTLLFYHARCPCVTFLSAIILSWLIVLFLFVRIKLELVFNYYDFVCTGIPNKQTKARISFY